MSLKDKLAHYGWELAFGSLPKNFEVGKSMLENMQPIRNPYKNKWFADPFILNVTEHSLEVLVEEFDYNVKRGRIAKLTIDTNTNIITDCKIILDLKTHLSFPVIYRVNETIYVHPENSESGSSYIYKYDKDTDMLVDAKLMIDEPLTDAIINKIGKDYYMFATKLPEPNGSRMHIYKSSTFIGGYEKITSVNYSSNYARMGGNFIDCDNKVYRIAQDCNGAYGKGLIIEEFDFNIQNCQRKTLVRWEMPLLSKYEGLHTFNTFNNTFIVDLKKYDYPLTHKAITIIKSLLK